jgi:dolichol-phosphate mannosyltransferase
VPLISVVIPVYKAEDCLIELYTRLTASLQTISPDYEIILVEDCGGDGSWNIISELANRDARVRGLQFSRNFGQHYGITAGIDAAGGEWVVVMDCDLQDRPEEIPRLYAKALEGYEVVTARRANRKHGVVKRTTSWMFYKVFNYFSGMHYDGQVGNFRIISRRVVATFRTMREQLRFFGGLVEWMGFPSGSIEVTHADRFSGGTTYTFRKLWKLAIEAILSYSDKPLRLAVKLGFFMSVTSFLYGGYIFTRSLLYGSAVLGWSSMIVSLYFIGGVIIAVLGITGIYIAKIFDETKKRPLYIIRRTTFDDR